MTGFTIRSFFPRTAAGSIIGYAKVATPGGIVFHDVVVRKKDGLIFAAPCRRPIVDRHGRHVLRDDGEPRWNPTVSFDSLQLRDKFSAAVVVALRVSNPELFQ